MEALSYSRRKLSRDELVAGVGGSVLAHILIFATAVILPWVMPHKSFQVPYYTVNLVSMKDIGGDLPTIQKGTNAKGVEGVKPRASQKVSSDRARSAPVVPVKRLRVEEAPSKVDHEIKKLDAPETPKFTESAPSTASVEKNLDKLITKPKAPAKSSAVTPPIAREETEKRASSQEPSNAKASAAASAAGQKTDAKPGAPSPGPAAGTKTGTEVGPKGSPEGSAKGSPEGVTKGGGGQSGSVGGSPDGAAVANARRMYYTAIWNEIRKNWSLPEFLKSQSLQAVLVLVVRRDGKVLDVQFEKRSGQPLFDESVERAVRKSDPLPPFPELYTAPKEEIGLRFNSADLT